MHCPVEALEAYVEGELGAADAAAVSHHLVGCARCQREQAWLVAERAVFAQRAMRDVAPAPLWQGVSGRARGGEGTGVGGGPGARPSSASAPHEGWRRAALAVAASLLMLATFGHREIAGSPSSTAPAALAGAGESEAGFSADPERDIVDLEERYGACLMATPTSGARCAAGGVPASFFFSRP